MHLWFSFFQPSSHFSWDTHSKQSLCLDEEVFLWLSFYSFGHWSNSFNLYWTLHALDALLSCICASCISLYALFWLFLHLILLLYFCFVCVKIQKHIKSENFKKFDHICLSTFHRFSLVPSYKWRSVFMSLTCYVCISIFVRKILKSMCDCCKSIFKLVMNDWSIVLIVLILA